MAFSSYPLIVLIAAFILSLNTSFLASSRQSHSQSQVIYKFYDCVNQTSKSEIEFSKGFYDPSYDKPSFTSILNSTAENLRCLAPTIQKPKAIFTPANYRQVQAAVVCAIQTSLNLRVRSGGHDYEGLSYISYTASSPFIIVDLRNINQTKIDIRSSNAWVDAGVTIGALYYLISQKNRTLAFPAGLYTDLGIGGHITGGAYGSLMRKHGLGIDNVLDAEIIDYRGKKLNRKSMGEDLFWAIRGGGGGNFGIIVRWKIQLVSVPENVTVFSVQRFVGPGKQGMGILQKWQNVSHTIANELFVRVFAINKGPDKTLTIYQGLYLGNTSELLKVMNTSFPELGLVQGNCTEMSWIESVVFLAGFSKPFAPRDLLRGKGPFLNYFKAKSDFVKITIPEEGIKGMFRIFGECPSSVATSVLVFTPYGGKMSEVPENATAYPHRDVLLKAQYVANWDKGSPELQLQNEDCIRKLYDYMGKYVTKKPRQTYVNYRDLDIGKKEPRVNCSYPSIWGPKYYKGNYKRLVHVKNKVDPGNLFHNEQSIPLTANGGCIPFD